MPDLNIKDKIVFISGSTEGIGLATAKLLLQHGAVVYINGRREKLVSQRIEELKKEHSSVFGMAGDAVSEEFTKKAINTIIENHGRIDFLVNNAGSFEYKSLESVTEEEWRRCFAVNLESAFLFSREVLPIMRKNNFGKIVNMASISGICGRRLLTPYSAAKGGLIVFTAALAKEVGVYKINVNAIAPGYIHTNSTSALRLRHEVMHGTALNYIPLGRLGVPEDVAGTVLFLLSDLANFITGETIVVSGGATTP